MIAAIAWIGSSFYFVAARPVAAPAEAPRGRRQGVGGELWEVHGGGFYHVQKYRVAPRELPDHLAWFKWEAYTTWLSGFALMVVLYYVNADTYLIDPSVADLEPWEAIAISVGLLAAAWIVYDALCRLLGRTSSCSAACIVGLTARGRVGLRRALRRRARPTSRSASMLGTIMAGTSSSTSSPPTGS